MALGLTASLATLLVAASEAARAFPIWLAWKLAIDLNKIDDEILTVAASTNPDRARLLQLEMRHGRLSRLYAVVSPSQAKPESGTALHPSDGRGVGQPAGPLGNPRR